MLRRRTPAAAWPAMRAILPAHLGSGFGSPSHQPRWRSWAQGQLATVTYAELFDGITKVLTRAIEDVGTDPGRWVDLVSHIPSLPAADRDRLLAAFEAIDPDSLGQEGRSHLWRALTSLTAQHRQFSDAPWAMPGDATGRVESIAARFAPVSLVELHAELFDSHPRLPGVDPRDIGAYDAALRSARRDAASAILDSGGIAELLRLGATVKLPNAVGWAAADAQGDDAADAILPLLGTDGPDGAVARGYAAGRADADGLSWVSQQLQRWPGAESVPRQTGLLLAVFRPSAALIAIVDGLHADVRASFWERMAAIYTEPGARPLVVHHLLEHRRAWAALSLLVTMLPSSSSTEPPPSVNLVESVLLAAAAGPSIDVQHAASLYWEAGKLLDFLETNGSDLRTRARLEFLFHGLLQHTRPTRALSEALQADPALFAEILSYVYWAENEPRDRELTPERKTIAEVGFAVVREWHTPPGVQADGTVDTEHLRDWVIEARRLLAESGRASVGDLSIGEVLAYAPPGSDGLWPAEPVRDLIEDLESPDFERGLRNGKFNSRGLVTWSPDGGGVQERGLAAQFRAWAERVADGWPRTAAVLRQLADHYDEWAQRVDHRSEDLGDQSP
jgi:hypothetical protein